MSGDPWSGDRHSGWRNSAGHTEGVPLNDGLLWKGNGMIYGLEFSIQQQLLSSRNKQLVYYQFK